jgi:hypothetical protein
MFCTKLTFHVLLLCIFFTYIISGIPKKVLNRNFHSTRPIGRPRTRWTDVVQRDALRLLGIRGWRRRAESRDELRCLMREAKARKGL